jgi:L-lactate dehydrogenase complex protein LldE
VRVGLFIPCFVDQLAPDAGMASVEVLERFGVQVDYPEQQTCCGQPLWNAGHAADLAALVAHFASCFAGCEHIVAPSASCVAMVRKHYRDVPGAPELGSLPERTFELCEFLTDTLGVNEIRGRFPHRVGWHPGCHGLRELGLGRASERMDPAPAIRDPGRLLLSTIDGLEWSEPVRPDDCCGFGGTFTMSEPAVSVAMGRARLTDYAEAGAEILTSGDPSCLLHLKSLSPRDGRPQPRVLHVAEVLAQAMRAVA